MRIVIASLGLAAWTFVACSSSSGSNGAPVDGGSGVSDSGGGDGGGVTDGSQSGSTTIAAARAGNVTTPITVTAVVIGVRGNDPVDVKEWYIEDPAGGPNAGIAVYCDHAAKQNPCAASVVPPALHDLVTVTGTITTYKGKLEITPTAQATVSANAALPPITTVAATDLAATGTSNLRGTLVKLATKVTVDSVTPTSLYYAKCAQTDGGVANDAGVVMCSGCKPPTYGGFQVNDGSGHELLVENHFYTSEHLQGSPECTTATGAIPVTVGMTFSQVTGILDENPTASVQTLSPVVDADYTTP